MGLRQLSIFYFFVILANRRSPLDVKWIRPDPYALSFLPVGDPPMPLFVVGVGFSFMLIVYKSPCNAFNSLPKRFVRVLNYETTCDRFRNSVEICDTLPHYKREAAATCQMYRLFLTAILPNKIESKMLQNFTSMDCTKQYLLYIAIVC